MSYAIIKNQTVIKLVNSNKKFIDYVVNKNPNAVFLESVQIDQIKNIIYKRSFSCP